MKAFLISFESNILIRGMVQVDANNEEEAIRAANIIINKNTNVENCMIELGTKNKNNDIIVIREMENKKETDITDILPLI